MKKIVGIFLVLTCTLPVFSQTLKQQRLIKQTALDIFESYVDVCNRLYQNKKDVYIYDQFLNLFSDTARVYNDILPSFPHGDQVVPTDSMLITPGEYFNNFKSEILKNSFSYDSLELYDIQEVSEQWWTLKCSFGRTVAYTSSSKSPYSRREFHYTMTIVMREEDSRNAKQMVDAKITNISVSDPCSQVRIITETDGINEENYFVDSSSLYKGPKHDTPKHDTLNSDRMPVGYYLKDDVKISDIKNEINANSTEASLFNSIELTLDNKHFYKRNSNKRDFWGLGINACPYGFGNKISSANTKKFGYENISQRNFSIEFSTFFGINLYVKNRYSLFLVPQLSLGYRNFNFSGDYSAQYQAVDIDGTEYMRNINVDLKNENVNQFTINFPISISNMFLLHKDKFAENQLFLSLDFGVLLSCVPFTRNTYDFSARYTGTYDFFGGVEFDHYYDYGNFDLNHNDIAYIPNSLINKFNIGILAGVGLMFQIEETSMLKFDLSFRNGFLSIAKYKEGFVLSEDYKNFESLLQASKSGAHNLYFSLSYIRAISNDWRITSP